MSLIRTAVLLSLVAACKKEAPPEAAKPNAESPRERAPIIEPVNFASGSTTIDAAELPAVQHAAEILKSTDWDVIVLGLADSSGDAAMNKELSEKRAEVVAAELKKLVPGLESRLTVHAIGERLATGATQSERKVEFVFYHPQENVGIREVVIRSRVLEEDFRAKREEQRQ